MPAENGSEDGSRWREAHARVAYHLIILAQLMDEESAKVAQQLLRHSEMYDQACGATQQPPPSRAVMQDYLEDFWATDVYLAVVPRLGEAPDGEGVDRIVARMIDAASADGGPVQRSGARMLSSAVPPRLSGTPTERLIWLMLYHLDSPQTRVLGASKNLWERSRHPVALKYRSVAWLHEIVGGSLSTIYDAVKGLAGRGVVSLINDKDGLCAGLRVLYTAQGADDRATYCYLRSDSLLPLARSSEWDTESDVAA
jgi:hypothetical protein